MSIELQSPGAPFQLKIDPLEVEERFGSFRAFVRCCIPHSANSGQFVYEADDIWFGYDDFDAFLEQLLMTARGNSAKASLHDMSNYVNFTITMSETHARCSIIILEPLDGDAKLQASFEWDRDLIGLIRDKFREFPRWW